MFLDRVDPRRGTAPLPSHSHCPRAKSSSPCATPRKFIIKLPKAEHDAEEWRAAMEALLLVAEHDGPTVFARIGVMRALNRHVEHVFNSDRKDQHSGRRKLAQDR
jgi:hypothetical protein